MSGYLTDFLTSFLSVFVGLFVLWSFLEVMTPGKRAAHAAIAGLFSAFVAAIITATVAASA